MNSLYIDTTSNQEIILRLTRDGKVETVKQALEKQKAQIVLPLIQKLLNKHQLTPQDIDAIEVNPGPGSFTGVRVGVSIANALSYALGIPVNKINVLEEEGIVEPQY